MAKLPPIPTIPANAKRSGDVATIKIITGPAGSGKSHQALERYGEHLRSELANGRFGTSLWLTPSRWSQQAVLAHLTSDATPICLDPRVETFGQFVESLLASTPTPFTPISQVGRRKLIRDIIDHLHHARQLPYFGSVAQTRGFLNQCVSFIAELKREEIWPENFQAEFQRLSDPATPPENGPETRPPASHRIIELMRIYETYQQRLRHGAPADSPSELPTNGQLYDIEGRFWIARKLIEQGHLGPFQNTQLVVVDGFTDFTRPQIAILAGLARWIPQITITLPLDAPGRRSEMFLKPANTRIWLRDAFADSQVEEHHLSLDNTTLPPAITHIARHLFDNPRDTPCLPRAPGCEILSCVRPSGEIDAIVKRVKTQLLAGVPPEKIVVVFRNLTGVSERFLAACRAARIPAASQTGPPILASGTVRLALTLLELEGEDWPHTPLMGILNSRLLHPEWLPELPPALVRRIGDQARFENIDRGRRPLLALFDGLARRASEANKTNSIDPAAREFLHTLSHTLDPLRSRHALSTWLDHWFVICRRLGIPPNDADIHSPDRWKAREARSWRGFLRLLNDARKIEEIPGVLPRELTLEEFRRQVLELVTGANLDPLDKEPGRVRLLSADEACHLAIDHLYFGGLGEGIVPQGRQEDCLLGETDRRRLGEAGVHLDHRASQMAEEMLLFYSVIARARQTLTLSYSSVNDKGETLNPSPYLEAVETLFAPGAVKHHPEGQLDPIPANRLACISESDFRLVATRELLEGSGDLWSSWAGRHESKQAALNLAAAFDMAIARFHTKGLTPYDGQLQDPANLARLRKNFPADYEFSVTSLETYAQDPFEFFLVSVLGVGVQENPRPRTDRRRRGTTLHRALARVHAEFKKSSVTPTPEELAAALKTEIDQLHRRTGDSPLITALREIEGEFVTSYIGRYAKQWREYQETFQKANHSIPQPKQFEFAFGNVPLEEDENPEVLHPTVEFGTGDATVRVRGRIDRIDIGDHEGAPVFTIIDYKLAKNLPRFSEEDFSEGKALQLLVYAAVAQKLEIVTGDLYQVGYWGLENSGFKMGIKTRKRSLFQIEADLRDSLQGQIAEILHRLAESIRAGAFAPDIKEDGRAYRAPVRHVARTASLRSIAEHLEKYPINSSI